MAQIESGATSDLATVDPTSKALRVSLYDTNGIPVHQYPTGSYALSIGLGRFTVLTTTGSIFAMRNASTRTIYIRKFHVWVSFDGTAAASTQIFSIRRFSTATPSGGTTLTLPAAAVKKNNAMSDSALTDARHATITSGTSPLTVTSVVFEQALARFTLNRNAGVIQALDFKFFDKPADQVVLAANEGIDIHITNTAVVGDAIVGTVEWDEVTI